MNAHQILGISETATKEEAKKAFKKLAHQHHPDKGGDIEKFKEISQAYTVLMGKSPQRPQPPPVRRQEHVVVYVHYSGGFGTGTTTFNF